MTLATPILQRLPSCIEPSCVAVCSGLALQDMVGALGLHFTCGAWLHPLRPRIRASYRAPSGIREHLARPLSLVPI
jgi:hypothetical protein